MTTDDPYIRPAQTADVIELANNMREADRRELIQWTAQDAYWGAQRSFDESDVAYSAFAPDGGLLTMFGAMRDNLMDNTAVIWSLSTVAVERNRLHFVRKSKRGFDMIARAMDDVAEFHNWISLEYKGAVRWMEWIGGSLAMNRRLRGICGGVFNEFYIMNPYYKEDN